MQVVPTQPVPNQTLQVQVNDQPVALNIYQLSYGLFVDVYVANALVIGGVLAQNLNRIVRSSYLGLVGDFAFVDVQDASDPVYTGLGDRYQLIYLDEADLADPGVMLGFQG